MEWLGSLDPFGNPELWQSLKCVPRNRRDLSEARSTVSLDPTANRHPGTNKRRLHCYETFSAWILKELSLTVDEENFPPQQMSAALMAFGKHLFYTGAPKYMFAETINAVIDKFPHYRGLVAAAWNTLRKWEEAEPTERAMVMPASIFQAAVALAILWHWKKFACAMLLGFHGLLRPSEILPLRRCHLVLPRDVLSSDPVSYVQIMHSKTSRFMLRQHARISDIVAVSFLDAVLGPLPREAPLFGASQGAFRTRWNRLFQELGVPTSEKFRGVAPKSLRGSGASWLYHLTEDVSNILWRGRWQSRRTLEHYLQDVMGQVLLTDLCQDRRDKVLLLSEASSFLLVSALG